MTEPTFADTIRRAMNDWDKATPAQREEALAFAADRARRADERLHRARCSGCGAHFRDEPCADDCTESGR